MDNGYWGYRYAIVINGKRKEAKKLKNELGNPFKTAKQAAKAMEIAIAQEKVKSLLPPQKKIVRRTVTEVYQEYCEKGRSGKAYATIRKQDSLWNNHLKVRFGKRYINEITVAEIQDYLEELYSIMRDFLEVEYNQESLVCLLRAAEAAYTGKEQAEAKLIAKQYKILFTSLTRGNKGGYQQIRFLHSGKRKEAVIQ